VIDSFLLPAALPRRITFVGKAEYLDDWKTKHLFPALGMIPIDRSGGDSSARALDAAAGPDDRLVLRRLTDEVMFEVRELSGQEYVDEYATRKHEAMPSQPTAIVLGSGNGERAQRVATGSGAVSAAR
jgi:hypothetical protein